MYDERIETHLLFDFSLCIENSKALLESISKEICDLKGTQLNGDESINKLVKCAFGSIGYETSTHINSGTLSTPQEWFKNPSPIAVRKAKPSSEPEEINMASVRSRIAGDASSQVAHREVHADAVKENADQGANTHSHVAFSRAKHVE